MEVNSCLNCISSCCRLPFTIDKEDYYSLKKIDHNNYLKKMSTMFIEENINYKDKEDFLDNLYEQEFAIINKKENGDCSFLDPETRLCTIYNDRPKVCKEFSNKSITCKNIKKCISTI